MSKQIIMGDFLNSDTMKEIKEKKQKELNEDVQYYFSELNMVINMFNDNTVPAEQFHTLYHNICDNLNETVDNLRKL